MHFNIANFLFPNFLIILTASFSSLKDASPDDIIIGFLVSAAFLISSVSVFSKEDILNIGLFNFFKNEIEVSSKTELNAKRPFFLLNQKFLYAIPKGYKLFCKDRKDNYPSINFFYF